MDGPLTFKRIKRDCSPVDIKMNCVYNYRVQSVFFYASIPFLPNLQPIDTNLSNNWY